MNEYLSLSSHIALTPRRRGLRASQDNQVEVPVRMQAPDAPCLRRKRLPGKADL
jgi:Ca-activated chloride channel homolog